MSEEETVFDPSLKKKKKKKPFDLDAAMGIAKNKTNEVIEEPQTIDLQKEELKDEDPNNEHLSEIESFGKKKKKKKTVKIDEGLNDSREASDTSIIKETSQDHSESLDMKSLKANLPVVDKLGDDLDLESFGQKKKRKKKRGVLEDLDDEAKGLEQEDEVSNPWDQTDRDYTYEELLLRVFGIMKEKNPEMVAGEKKKFVMRPPQVVRAGAKKTAFVNFTDMANSLHRQPKHLLSFIFAELGTVGSVDGSNQLILKGRFQQKHMENVIRRYIKEYVTCHTCKSPTTVLEKEDRIYFLKCISCHSKCSVQTIKAGFQAVTSKRAAMRAKQ